MDRQQEKMFGTDTITMVFAAFSIVVGGIGNIIVLVHCVCHGSRQGLNPFLLIAFSLSVSNLVLICFQSIMQVLAFLGEACLQHWTTLLDRVSMVFLCYCLWLSTWLSLYYQVKIVPTLTKFFAWLKARFNDVLPWLMLFSGLLSLTVGFCIFLDKRDGLGSNSCNSSTENSMRPMGTDKYSLQVYLYCSFVTLSFLMTFKCVTAILYSLHRHVCNLRCKSSGFTSTNLEAHYTAAMTVATLLIFNFLLFLSQVAGYLQHDSPAVSMMTSIALSVLLIISPYIIINGNSKLKMEVKGTFQRILNGRENLLSD